MSLWRSVRFQIIAIVILALVLRIAMFTVAKHQRRFFHGAWDMHTEIGRNVMQGNGIKFSTSSFIAYRDFIRSHPSGWVDFNEAKIESDGNFTPVSHIDFGYGVLAGLVWKCLGKIDWRPIILLQIVIDSLMCIPLYFIGKNIGDRRKGLLTAALFALFPLEMFRAIIPSYDVWVTFCYILCVYLILLEQKQEKRWLSLVTVAGIGGINAYTAWMRSTVVLFPVIIVIYLLLRRKGFQWVKAVLLIVVFSCLYIVPKALHTYVDTGELRITRGVMWGSFYAGLGQFENDFGIEATDASAMKYCVEKDPELAGKNFFDNWQRYEEIWEVRVKEIIRENPLWYAGTVFKRAGLILFPGLYYHKEGVFRYIPFSILIYLKILLMAWSVLFLFGSYVGLRKCFWVYMAILLPYLYVLATISPFFFQGRIIISVYFIQFIACIEALWYFGEKLKQRRSGGKERAKEKVQLPPETGQ